VCDRIEIWSIIPLPQGKEVGHTCFFGRNGLSL
jgi:hypothetical protein